MTTLKPLPSRYDLNSCHNVFNCIQNFTLAILNEDSENVLFIPHLQAEIAQLMSLIINTFYRLAVNDFISHLIFHFPFQTLF